MNQTRVFLMIAWLMVAVLLWMEWGRFTAPKADATPPAALVASDVSSASVPNADGLSLPAASAAAAPNGPVSQASTEASTAQKVVVTTDLLRLVLDGSRVLEAQLLAFPQTKAAGSPPVKLLNTDPASRYTAAIGWTNASGNAPGADAVFLPEQAQSELKLAEGADALSVPFIWRGPDGLSIRRTFAIKRGEYVVTVTDQVINTGAAPWNGFVYRQLERVPPVVKAGMTNPESFSLNGATWYGTDAGYNRRPFKDYLEDGKVDQQVSGGWIAMVQHHFFTAWIPQAQDTVKVSLDSRPVGGASLDSISEVGPGVSVAPGQQATTSARLWVGPKEIDKIKAQNVPNLDRAVDYSRFSIFAVIGRFLFWIMSHLHAFLGNWGWSIVGLVVLVKIVLLPLTAAQYKSSAKMRKFAPRLQQLKERYGEDRQKYQQAMMELYKKEKINPAGGCLPILITIPIFMAMYWVLAESVELRQAPWMGWIQDLTARDPFFVLPVLNMVIMWATQKLTPMVGMDPMQQKMMQAMPLVFGVILAFLPAGLVLYQVVNGGLGLLQQWWMTKKYSGPAAPAAAK